MENYVLNWSEHRSQMASQCQMFRSREAYADVMFYCEDEIIRAHRLVLAAGSAYFDRLFSAVPNNGNPVLVLRDTRRDLLLLAINFIYEGEARVPSCDFGAFMALADSLEIKGLREEETYGGETRNVTVSRPRAKGRPNLTKRPVFPTAPTAYSPLVIPPCPPLAKRMFSEALAATLRDQHVIFPGCAPPDSPPDEPIDATVSHRDNSDEEAGEKRGNVSDGDSGTAGSLTGNRHETESDASVDERNAVLDESREDTLMLGHDEAHEPDEDEDEADGAGPVVFPGMENGFNHSVPASPGVSDFGLLTGEAEHSDTFPTRVPDVVDQSLRMSRVTDCMWRGKTADTGKVLYFCELCLYSSGHKGNAVKHNHFRGQKKSVSRPRGPDFGDNSQNPPFFGSGTAA